MSSEQEQLGNIREEIDAIDQQLLALISERARCAQRVAAIKLQAGETVQFYRPEREASVLTQMQTRNPGPLSDAEIARLFREIMSTCLALESPLQVAYLGPPGTYSQEALFKQFGGAVVPQQVSSIDLVFREVEKQKVAYGVVPLENTTEGSVNITLDLLQETPLQICGEIDLPIRHNLLSREASLASIKVVIAHQQALAQCRIWLDTHLPTAERTAVSSNGEAAKRASTEPHTAAIASQAAADLYQLPVLEAQIEDYVHNTTRFIVLGQESVPPSGRDKTSLLVSTHNEAGALEKMLAPFSRHQISLTRIESRPSKRSHWDYVFFVDVEGHQTNPALADALRELEQVSLAVKILGSYPRAVF